MFLSVCVVLTLCGGDGSRPVTLAVACLCKEKRLNSERQPYRSTWQNNKKKAAQMFVLVDSPPRGLCTKINDMF